MIEGHAVLAVVPARGGSKSIPRKNLKEIGGISLVGRAAMVARALPWIDAALISTDDRDILAEAERYGLDTPFLRPDDLSGDQAGSADMWRHAWIAAEKHYGRQFDISVLLEPTSPMRRPEDVDRTVRTLIETGAPAAATVSRTPAHFTPHKTLTLNEGGTIGFYLSDGARHSLRQGIPAYYHRNGLCYAVTRSHLVDHGRIIDRDAQAVVIERHVVNIDDPFELELAEWLLNRERHA
jgi:CMP-N,N'-diacetyllegionaminic acid synthase